jgi:hypothetical protein
MVDEKFLAEHYGDNWSHVRGLLTELTRHDFWQVAREMNLVPILASMQSTQDANELAREIIEKRLENRVLWTLETQFTPSTNERI